MKPIVIITAPAHPYLTKRLQDKGFEVVLSETITYDALADNIGGATGLVVSTRIKIDQAILEKAVSLKWIARLGSGMELIDTHFAASKNIICVSSPEGNAGAVGEHTMALLLNLMNKVSASFAEVKNDLGYYIPNAFTPNNDGKNDVFNFRGTGITSSQLRIFNRWGEQLFKNTNTSGWDGKYMGEISQEGVYVFLIKVKSKRDKWYSYSGTLTLLR